MRTLALAGAAAIAALGGPGDALARPAEMHHAGGAGGVTIGFTSFAPAHVDVLVGDTQTWHNDGGRRHTVTAADGAWSSAQLGVGGTFSHRFDAVGSYPYYCRLHPAMRGEVDVHRLLLTAPRGAAARGRPLALSGRAALPEGTKVAIRAEAGGIAEDAAEATVGADGSFHASVVPRETTRYRAVAGGDSSAPVNVLVLDRKVSATRHRHGRRAVFRVRVSPHSPGAVVVLQLRLRERFGWWPVRHARLGRHSTARFSVRVRRGVRARAVLTMRDRATVLGTSATLRT